MKKIFNILLLIVTVVIAASCDNDPINDVECSGEVLFGDVTSEITNN